MSKPIACLNCNTINWGDSELCSSCSVKLEIKMKDEDSQDTDTEIHDQEPEPEKTPEEIERERKEALENDPELRRKYLREKIRMKAQSRKKLNINNSVFEKGKRVRGARQNFVPQITVPSLAKANIPDLV